MRDDNIRSRLTLALAILLLPLVGYLVLTGWSITVERANSARETAQYFATIASNYEGEQFSKTQSLFRNLAEDPVVRAGGKACDDNLARLSSVLGAYRDIAISDASGAVICASSADIRGSNLSDQDYFAEIKRGRDFAVGAHKVGTTRSSSVAVAMPLRSADGDPAGAIVGTIDLTRLRALFTDSGLPPNSSVYLFDQNGLPLAGVPDLPEYARDPVKFAAMLKGADQSLVSTGGDGIERIFVASPNSGQAITAVFGLPIRAMDVFGSIDRTIAILGPIAIWLIGLAFVWFATDFQIGRPVRRLVRTARALSEGDLTARPALQGPRELDFLATAFREMATRIAAREQELKDAIATRDAMLREIHHRVKNNLQIVISQALRLVPV